MYDRFGDNINWKLLIWYVLTSKKFRCHLKGTILYALINYDEKRGDNSSEVCLFDHWYGHKIINSNNIVSDDTLND